VQGLSECQRCCRSSDLDVVGLSSVLAVFLLDNIGRKEKTMSNKKSLVLVMIWSAVSLAVGTGCYLFINVYPILACGLFLIVSNLVLIIYRMFGKMRKERLDIKIYNWCQEYISKSPLSNNEFETSDAGIELTRRIEIAKQKFSHIKENLISCSAQQLHIALAGVVILALGIICYALGINFHPMNWKHFAVSGEVDSLIYVALGVLVCFLAWMDNS